MEKAQGKLTSDNHASCSGVAALFGASPYETKNEYLDSRIRARKGENVRSEKSIYAEMGNILENPILEITCEKLGLSNLEKNITTPVLHEEYPLGGSIDGIAYCQNNLISPDDDIIYTEDDKPIMLDGKGILEAKATALMPEADCKPTLWRGLLQVKALMAITGYSWGCVSTIYRSTLFKMFLLRRDFAFETKLKEVILDFERRITAEDYYPPVTLKDTQIMFPEPKKAKEIELDNDAASTYLDLIYTADEQIKALNKAKENAQIKVQELMGDAEIGFNKNYQVKWGSTTYKAQPEKIVPAKEARTVRNKTLRIKKIEHEEGN